MPSSQDQPLSFLAIPNTIASPLPSPKVPFVTLAPPTEPPRPAPKVSHSLLTPAPTPKLMENDAVHSAKRVVNKDIADDAKESDHADGESVTYI